MTTTTQDRTEWLANLKTGDRVRHHGTSMMAVRSYSREETITAATKRYVTIGHRKFRRSDGGWTGNSNHGWGRYISPVTA